MDVVPNATKSQFEKMRKRCETKLRDVYYPKGLLPENLVGVCGPLPKTLTLFMTKICYFPYPVYDLTENLIPYL